jgi:hypothetical protein
MSTTSDAGQGRPAPTPLEVLITREDAAQHNHQLTFTPYGVSP